MGHREVFWLRCRSCGRRGKYIADPEEISYQKGHGLILKWGLECKFCSTPLTHDNLTEMSVKELYMYLAGRQIGVADLLLKENRSDY